MNAKTEEIRCLSDLKKGEEALIDGFENNNDDLIRLRDMGLHEGIALRVIKFAPTGDPIQIKTRGFYLSIRKSQAKQIRIKKKIQVF